MKILLHAACGPATLKDLDWLRDGENPMFEDWSEVRLDIDSKYGAEIVGDVRDLHTWDWQDPELRDTAPPFDAVFCSHALEHLHLYDAPKCLATFRAVLKPDGFLLLIVPNFEAACRHVVEGRGAKLYDSPAGPIFAHEVIYGKENWTLKNPYQRHLTGYTPDLLRGLVVGAGFRIASLTVDDVNLMIAAVPS